MACSCSSSLTGASASSRTSSLSAPASASASSSSAAPSSVSFRHLYHLSSGISSTIQRGLLHPDSGKSAQQVFCSAITARQGNFDASKKNVTQRGNRDGRNASVAVKEDKKSSKGGGGRNSNAYQYNSNLRTNNNSRTSTFQNNRPSNTRGNRSTFADEEEDETDKEGKSAGRKSTQYRKARKEDPVPISSIAERHTRRLSNFSDDEEVDESEDDPMLDEDADIAFNGEDSLERLIMPIPPAGFVLADDGSVSVMAPPHKRIATLIDPQTKLSLECLIRRVFSSSDGRRCFLLCPLDTPLQILRIDEGDVLKEVSDEELEDIFPTASFELAKQRLHLVQSGLCLTLRGAFCFSEDDVINLNASYNESSDTLLNEGVEIANFSVNDSEYLMFTPLDPLMFVAYEDQKTGELLVADDDLMDDEPVLDAIDDEKEFQAYMEDDVIVGTTSDEEDL